MNSIEEIIKSRWEELDRYEEDFLNDEFEEDQEAIQKMINERETPISFPIEDYILENGTPLSRSEIRHTNEYTQSFHNCLFFYAGKMLSEETYDSMEKNIQYLLHRLKNYVLEHEEGFHTTILGIEDTIGDENAKIIDNEKLDEDVAFKRTYLIDVLCREYTTHYIEHMFQHQPSYKEIEQYYYYFVLVIAIMYELEYRIVRPVIDNTKGIYND